MAKFSRAHYVILANALLRAKCKLLEGEDHDTYGGAMTYTGLNYAIEEITSALAADNRAFDKNRFMEWIKGDGPRGRVA